MGRVSLCDYAHPPQRNIDCGEGASVLAAGTDAFRGGFQCLVTPGNSQEKPRERKSYLAQACDVMPFNLFQAAEVFLA